MTQKAANFELGTSGNTIGTGDAGSADAWNAVTIAAGHTITYDRTSPAANTAQDAKFTFSDTGLTVLEWSGMGTMIDLYGRFYLRISTLTGNRTIVSINNNSNTPHATIFIHTSKLKIYTLGGAVQMATTVADFPVDSLTRVEYHIGISDTVGFARLKTFNNPDSTTATEDVGADSGAFDTNAGGSGGFDRIQIGQTFSSSAVAQTLYVDQIVAGATQWVGPEISTDIMLPMGMLGTGRV